jgi:hypothetical protein
MWTRKVIAIAAVTVLAGALAACGDDSSSKDKVKTADAPAKADPATEKLRGALLTVKDLPAGFAADDQESKAKYGTSACAKALDTFGVPAGPGAGNGGSPKSAQLIARFVKGDLGPHIEQVIQRLPEKEAAAGVGRTKDALAKCKTWEERGAGGAVTKANLAIAHSGAGNDVVSARLVETTGSERVVTDLVALRVHGVVCVLRASAAKSLDDKLVLAVTKTAAERLRGKA